MRIPERAPWRNALLPYYGFSMLLSGLAAGVLSLVVLTRRHERSWLVWLALLNGVLVVLFLLGKFLVPH